MNVSISQNYFFKIFLVLSVALFMPLTYYVQVLFMEEIECVQNLDILLVVNKNAMSFEKMMFRIVQI